MRLQENLRVILLRSPSFDFRKLNLLGKGKGGWFERLTALTQVGSLIPPQLPSSTGRRDGWTAAEAMPLGKPNGSAWSISDVKTGSHSLTAWLLSKSLRYFFSLHSDSLQIWLWVAMLTDLATWPQLYCSGPTTSISEFQCIFSKQGIWLCLGQMFTTGST